MTVFEKKCNQNFKSGIILFHENGIFCDFQALLKSMSLFQKFSFSHNMKLKFINVSDFETKIYQRVGFIFKNFNRL